MSLTPLGKAQPGSVLPLRVLASCAKQHFHHESDTGEEPLSKMHSKVLACPCTAVPAAPLVLNPVPPLLVSVCWVSHWG